MPQTSELLYMAATDPKLNERTSAVTVTEAYNNPAVSEGTFAEQVRRDPFGTPVREFQWPVALNCGASYASGEATTPGGGADNVTDAELLSAIQAHWPPAAG